MGIDPNGARGDVPTDERLNVFALVIYIPDPLGRFFDDLRRELAPRYKPRAHVSVLPPRPLGVDWRVVSEHIRDLAGRWEPFAVEAAGIRVFPATNVVHIELGAGSAELAEMHAAMNSRDLEFEEPFPYHPHITLAQEVSSGDVERVRDLAARRWQEFRGPRAFRAERAVLVQSTVDNRWVDLAEISLGDGIR